MREDEIPLTKLQKEIMQEFYGIAPTKVIFNKTQRREIWNKATRHEKLDFNFLKKVCPALEHRIQMTYQPGERNIQSAVFSECVYAQTYANMLNLDLFVNCYEDETFIPDTVVKLLRSYNLVARYVYSTNDKKRMLIQAGSCNGIDSALITVINLNIYTIEFKEPYAKTSEPDLPKYGENGILFITTPFLGKYYQFEAMLDEQAGLNFFENIGNNIHNFSQESIKIAVSNNYKETHKYADVICTEDKDGYLVMLPSNQIQLWANVEGEIRPAGRNHYKVWTPAALKKFLAAKNAVFNGSKVTVEKSKLDIRTERGGAGRISGYKINSLFFVYLENCEDDGARITFDISNVRQLNPTIAAKVDFRSTLRYHAVKEHYQQFF